MILELIKNIKLANIKPKASKSFLDAMKAVEDIKNLVEEINQIDEEKNQNE